MRNKPLPRPEPPKPDQEFWTIKEVAKHLRQSPSTVRRRIASGELRSVKDAKVIVHRSDLRDYIERRRRGRRLSKRRPILGDLVHPPANQPQVIDPPK